MKYKLKWKDDFKKDGKPNNEIWTYETGGHGFGNNEKQFYTDNLKNAYVENGILNIVAYKENYENNEYTSAKLTTYGKKHIKYGKIIVKAKLPKGNGTWPAIWMLPVSIQNGNPWPYCGEIDIMEHVGKNQDYVHFSLHSKKYNHQVGNQPTHVIKQEGVTDTFNDYEVRWDSESISFYVNNEHHVTFKKNSDDSVEGWPFDEEFYLILNLAIGGWWGGEIDDSILPAKLQIQSVEVYEKD
ncbi:glycoside hydrolase family 16 protein [Haploplasma axanthum]|nr:glycoside hydrolase family 16 protein [Haploplasma axanthum]